MTIKLTDNEWGILEHRLDLTDCLAECYADTAFADAEREGKTMTDEQHKVVYEMAEAAADKLKAKISTTREINTDALTEIDRWFLTDCMEGSTFFCGLDDAVWDGEISKGKALAQRKAGHSLQRKLNEAGIEGSICWD